MTVCGQFDVLGDGCPGCGGWLHRVMRGGFIGPDGFWYCDEDCIVDYQVWKEQQHVQRRDLLCACEICVKHGRPTQAELTEYQDYLDSLPPEMRMNRREPTSG